MTDREELEEIAEALEAVGLTAEEGQVYLLLLQAGPSKARGLVPAFDASRSKLYRLLDEMSQKGFVSKSLERPTVYHPVPPGDAFTIQRANLKQQREHLDAVQDELLPRLERLHRVVEGPEPTDWKKVEDTERIYEVLQRVVAEAQESVWVASNQKRASSPRSPLVRETWRALERTIEEGVSGRVLMGPTAEAFEHVPHGVLEAGGQARVVEVERPVRFVIADRSVVVTWAQTPPRQMRAPGEEVAIHTDADTLAGMHVVLFERLWSEAVPLSELGKAPSHKPGT